MRLRRLREVRWLHSLVHSYIVFSRNRRKAALAFQKGRNAMFRVIPMLRCSGDNRDSHRRQDMRKPNLRLRWVIETRNTVVRQ